MMKRVVYVVEPRDGGDWAAQASETATVRVSWHGARRGRKREQSRGDQ